MGGMIEWLGHACFRITSGEGMVIIIDPWLTDNPKAPIKADEIESADAVLVTHDHFDHMADAAYIVKAAGAILIGIPETVGRLRQEEGVPEPQIIFGTGMNIGGTAKIEEISVTMTQAFHSSHTGSPAGYIIRLEDGFTIYHAGDTGIFYSMKTLGELYSIDLAMLPIGGVFTMDPQQASLAARLLAVSTVIPMHYGTFPVLEKDTSTFRETMKEESPYIEVVVLEPGQEYKI